MMFLLPRDKHLKTAQRILNQLYVRSQFTLFSKDILRDEDLLDQLVYNRSVRMPWSTNREVNAQDQLPK